MSTSQEFSNLAWIERHKDRSVDQCSLLTDQFTVSKLQVTSVSDELLKTLLSLVTEFFIALWICQVLIFLESGFFFLNGKVKGVVALILEV